MKLHTQEYKDNVKLFGRELDSIITYELDGETIELGAEELNSVTPHYESSLLKSVMKQLDIDSNVDIPLDTVLNYQFGIKVRTGKNLYKPFNFTKINNGITFTYSNDGSINLNGTSTAQAMSMYSSDASPYLIILKPGTYTISGEITDIKIEVVNSSGTAIGYTAGRKTFTISETTDVFVRLVIDNGKTFNNIKVYPQLEKGSQATEYEKFGAYEYINFGNYIVYKSEKQEDTNSWKITCYDKMLYSMIPYESLGVSYPITIKNYLSAICTKLGLTLATEDFVNADKEILSELYLDSDGNSLDYTFRDVLDEIAQTTASVICINEDDELEVRYPQNAGEYETAEGTSLYLENVDDEKGFNLQLNGNTVQNGTPTPDSPIEVQTVSGNQEINIVGKNYFDNNIIRKNQGQYNVVTDTTIASGKKLTYTSSTTATTTQFLVYSIMDLTNYVGKTIRFKTSFEASGTNKGRYYIGLCNADGSNRSSKATSSLSNSTISFVVPQLNGNQKYLCLTLYANTEQGTINENDYIEYTNMVLTINDEDMSYEEYKSQNYEISLGNIELCKIGNYQDKIYKQNGKWYLYKTINKTILDGSEDETYSYRSDVSVSGYKCFRYSNFDYTLIADISNGYSSHFKYVSSGNSANSFRMIQSSGYAMQFILSDNLVTTSVSSFKTWLSNNNVPVYYVTTPTTVEITDTELINQLETVRLQLGINNVSIDSSDLSSPLKLTYLKYWETIDEEYLKDVNVNFGEKFGPVNSIVLSRSAESDNIYQKDYESIELNGLTEIKIKDNQILNGNNRDLFLPEIYNKLNGLEYYVNDYTSTGIAYLDLLDFYKVKVDENNYKCLMLNDELNVTQGLQEQIHAERMEDSETDYTKADKTDRKLNKTTLIVDKQNQLITSAVQNISTLQTMVNTQGNQIDTLGTTVTQAIDNITASVTGIEDTLENGVTLVKTTSVTINNDGLNVSTDNSKISTTMSNNAFEIKSSGTPLAFFGYDEDEGISKAEMNNLTVTNYFVAGYHRTEKYDIDGEHRTGVFYIGG